MKRAARVALWITLLALTGCPAAHSDYPDKSCKQQSDCYLDESCVIAMGADTGQCVPSAPDLSHPVPGDGGAP